MGLTYVSTHSSLVVLATGLVAALGVIGWGLPIVRLTGVAAVLRWPLSWLTGILMLSGLTQLLAFSGLLASTIIYVAILLALSALAVATWLGRERVLSGLPRPVGPAETSLAVVIGILALLSLAVAVTPATRHDEIAYHVLVPARIWTEGGIFFHPLPYEATVWPQLSWHVAQVVFHAIGVSDASAVLALSGTLLLVGMGGAMVWQAGASPLVAMATMVALLASGYSIVFMTTLGPHAFQYLATTLGVLAALYGDRLIAVGRPTGYALTVAIAAAAMIVAKLPMVPLAAVGAMVGLYWLRCAGAAWPEVVGAALLMGLIVLLAATPLAIWATLTTGSPGGVTTLSPLADPSSYDAETLAVYRAAIAKFIEESSFKPAFELTYWNPLVGAGTLLYLAVERLPVRRVIAGAFLLVQLFVLIFALPLEIRHLGGLQYALTIATVIAGWERWGGRAVGPLAGWSPGRRESVFAASVLVLVAPWAALVCWAGAAFVPVATGMQRPAAFLGRYTPLAADFALLDRRLPRDAVLLVVHPRKGDMNTLGWLSRPPMAYAPRPAFFHSRDMPVTGRPYVLLLRAQGTAGIPDSSSLWLPAGWQLEKPVLHNPAACFYPQRLPGGGCHLIDLLVLSMRREEQATP